MLEEQLEPSAKNLTDICMNKFNLPIAAVSISRTAVEVPSGQDDSIIYEFLSDSFICKHYPKPKSSEFTLIDMNNREVAMNTVGSVISRLKENAYAL